MIYIIQSIDGGNVKIGTTIRLSQRLKALEWEYKQKFCVLAVFDGGFSEEKTLHRKFADIHVKDEWFAPSDDLLSFIRESGREWDGYDEKPIRSLANLKGTEEFGEWLDQLVDHSRQGTRSLLALNALRCFAERHGFALPPAIR